MFGWNGNFLKINLSKNRAIVETFDSNFAFNYLGGRGFAAKILWDNVKPEVDALSPENKLVFAAGPLTGFGFPNSGKLVVAAKSPLTGGYGDGNMGTNSAVQMRKAGYDAVIVEGKAKSPTILYVQDKNAEFVDAKDFWGLDTFETEKRLKELYEKSAGIISIGPGGENLVKFATVISQEGRSGGRPGMGAVMGSKNLKAVVFEGSGFMQAAHPNELKDLGASAFREIMMKPDYGFWKRQGTMNTVEWCQENSTLPAYNYREAMFDQAPEIGGSAMEKIKVSNRGCPQCNMTCGNVVMDSEKKQAEIDYENIAMLGSNIGLGNLEQVSSLNRFADELGLDAISLGNVLGFAMEASEKRLIAESVEWGKFEEIKDLIYAIASRKGLGDALAEGVRYFANMIGRGASDWAMHVKGLETTAYDCHAAPLMALSYGTSSIGAHHKDAWLIGWDVTYGRENYDEVKVEKLIDAQRLRGGIFESLVLCRFPYNSLGLELDWYPKALYAATGMQLAWSTLNQISDRVWNLIRAFWVREFSKDWTKEMDTPPERWFSEPLTEGPLRGRMLNREKYDAMLGLYYQKRGWDERGIPKKSTLGKLGLPDVTNELNKYVALID